MGLVIKSDEKGIRIWKDEKSSFPRYSYSISRKKTDGNGYDTCYKSVKFKKDVSVENGTDIIVDNAFESFDIGKDGKKYPYLMVTDFHYLEDKSFIDVPDGIEEAMPFT